MVYQPTSIQKLVCFFLFASICDTHALANPSGLDKGFNILGSAGKIIPQGRIVQTAKETLKFAWKRMMAELAPQDKSGAYVRPSYNFQGEIGTAEFIDEPGRYHIYVGNPCPWCHRVRLALALRKIKPEQIGVTVLVDDPVKASRGGWIFDKNSKDGRDPLGSNDLRELYDKLSANYKGRCTAPLLIDLKSRKIVSNESADIVRMLNGVDLGCNDPEIMASRTNLLPEDLLTKIEDTNAWVYNLLNNGVYRCGFSTQQSAYDRASKDVRQGLADANEVLRTNDYLCGEVFTEADLRLLPTILRFDGAYAPLFRAGGAHLRIRDYPYLLAWLQRCWDIEGVQESIDLQDASTSYYKQLFPLNPGGLIPTPLTAADIGLQ